MEETIIVLDAIVGVCLVIVAICGLGLLVLKAIEAIYRWNEESEFSGGIKSAIAKCKAKLPKITIERT